ncbi:MAG TPA: ABC transporter substrate-binding protein [Stellaceae bacterium]|nr:ABC transporter substrate-binding protein [Stellaceae bacterium]
MTKLRLSFSCWDYDRMRALADGSVVPEGIELVCMKHVVEETFFRMARHREFDLAEMSLSSYTVSLSKPDRPFIAIPVFPSRMFRHSFIYVSAQSGIKEPKDLAGRRIGTPEYQLTAPVWIRGILQDEYGLDPASPRYFTGGLFEPGRVEKIALDLPPKFKLEAINPSKTLSAMIAAGELDAIQAPHPPSTFYTAPDRVKRLFENYVEIERAYFRKTKIFPIMHTVAIRREVYEANRWIAQSLFKAFVEAQRKIYDQLRHQEAYSTMLPWQMAYVEETQREFGDDWWAYGLEPNRHVLDTFLRYHHEQGLSPRRLKPEDLFAPETFESFKV